MSSAVTTIDDFSQCIHGAEAPCSSVCPLHVDIRSMIMRLKRGNFHSAYNIYRSSSVFPALVSRICPAPCKEVCGRVLGANPVSIPLLERSFIEQVPQKNPPNYHLPSQQNKVAVIGASPGGLACALRLAEKGYPVTVFEREDAVGGALKGMVPQEVIDEEIALQYKYVQVDFQLSREVQNEVGILKTFDAVYVASGSFTNEIYNDSFLQKKNVFVLPKYGQTDPYGIIQELADGIRISEEISWFLSTGRYMNEKLHVNKRSMPVMLFPARRQTAPSVCPAKGLLYSKAEIRKEAVRCSGCDCTLCIDQCILLRQYGMTPVNLSNDVGISTNIFPDTQGHAAMREIGSCNNCGLCRAVCPVGIDIGNFLIHARALIKKNGDLPPAHHEYWMRDMAFSDSEDVSLFYLPDGEQCTYLFFPGCQAGGSDPQYVLKTYEKILKTWPSTGLLLRCCGAPALWAGEEDVLQKELRYIRKKVIESGAEEVLLICPSCYRMFRDNLPDIKVRMVYELREFIPEEKKKLPFSKVAVFDPCSSRDFPDVQEGVRRILLASGLQIIELQHHGKYAQCCSWGGHGYTVNPVFANSLVSGDLEEGSLPYINYCTNCRDIFAGRGKECRHILDIVLDINREFRRPPTITRRRTNRKDLKRELIKQYHIDLPLPSEDSGMRLKMSADTVEKLDEKLILKDDIVRVIKECEKTGVFLIDEDTGHRIGHRKLGYITYWVEFEKESDDVYILYNAYSHRMSIKSEIENV